MKTLDRFDGDNGGDDLGVNDRAEVAAQVEACLRDMWCQHPDTAAASAAVPHADGTRPTSRLGGVGGGVGSRGVGSRGVGSRGVGNAIASLSPVEEVGAHLHVERALLPTDDDRGGCGGGGGDGGGGGVGGGDDGGGDDGGGGRGGGGLGGGRGRATERLNAFRLMELDSEATHWEIERMGLEGAATGSGGGGGGGGGGGDGGVREEIGEEEKEEGVEGKEEGGNFVAATYSEEEEQEQAKRDAGGVSAARAGSAEGGREVWRGSVFAEERAGVEEAVRARRGDGWDVSGSGEETLVEGLETLEEGGLDEEAVDMIEIVVPPCSFSSLVLVVADLERASRADVDSLSSSTA